MSPHRPRARPSAGSSCSVHPLAPGRLRRRHPHPVQTERGLSDRPVADGLVAMGLTVFFLELPTSGFADAFGRRPVYITSAVVNVVAVTAYALAQSFWVFVVAGALMGAFRALDSGPLEAWFVDTVHETTPGADVDRQRSRAGHHPRGGDRPRGGALRPAHLVEPRGSVFGHEDASALDAAVGCRRPSASCTWSSRRRDARDRAPSPARAHPRRARPQRGPADPAVIKSGLLLLGRNRVLMGLVARRGLLVRRHDHLRVLHAAAAGGDGRLAQEAGALVGPVSAAGWALFGVGAWLAGLRRRRRIGVARAAILGRVLNALGAVVMGLVAGPGGLIAAYLFTYSMHGMNGPPHAALLHREAEAEPLHGAVDQLDDGVPGLRDRRTAARRPRRQHQPRGGDGDGRCGEHPRRVLLPPGPAGGEDARARARPGWDPDGVKHFLLGVGTTLAVLVVGVFVLLLVLGSGGGDAVAVPSPTASGPLPSSPTTSSRTRRGWARWSSAARTSCRRTQSSPTSRPPAAGCASPEGLRADRLDIDATIPFETVAEQVGEGVRIFAAGGGLAGIERQVTLLGRDVTVSATGTVVADGGQLLIEPETVDLGGPAFLDSAASALARTLVTIREDVPGVPEGMALTDVEVTDAGFAASLSGTDVTIGR